MSMNIEKERLEVLLENACTYICTDMCGGDAKEFNSVLEYEIGMTKEERDQIVPLIIVDDSPVEMDFPCQEIDPDDEI